MYFEQLMEKVLLNEKYCIKNYSDFTILRGLLTLDAEKKAIFDLF